MDNYRLEWSETGFNGRPIIRCRYFRTPEAREHYLNLIAFKPKFIKLTGWADEDSHEQERP